MEAGSGIEPLYENSQSLPTEGFSGYGVPQEEIARLIGISEKTLRKYFEAELHDGMTKANAAVAQSLYQTALGPGKAGIVAAIFSLKC